MSYHVVFDAGTREKMIQIAGTQLVGASDEYKANINMIDCEDLCRNISQCLMATFDGNNCYIYFKVLPQKDNTGSTSFNKVEITSVGM